MKALTQAFHVNTAIQVIQHMNEGMTMLEKLVLARVSHIRT
jgi:hypothetical protein